MSESSPVDAEIIFESSDSRILLAGTGAVLVVIILIFAATQYFAPPADSDSSEGGSRSATIVWDQSIYMPRHEECVDDSNGQDLPEFGIGYEPSISITSNGNMFITAHKDLRWGGEDSPSR